MDTVALNKVKISSVRSNSCSLRQRSNGFFFFLLFSVQLKTKHQADQYGRQTFQIFSHRQSSWFRSFPAEGNTYFNQKWSMCFLVLAIKAYGKASWSHKSPREKSSDFTQEPIIMVLG